MEKYGRTRQATDDNIIRLMRVACWITKATDSHPEYVILLFRANWLCERVSLLRSPYIAYLVTYSLFQDDEVDDVVRPRLNVTQLSRVCVVVVMVVVLVVG